MTWPPKGRMNANDRDLADFKMFVSRPRGFLDAPVPSGEGVPVPGRAGHARAPGERQIGPRPFTVPGVILADTDEAVATLWGQAKQLLLQEDLEVWFQWWPDRLGKAHYRGIRWLDLPGHTRGAPFELAFEMDDPHKYSRQPDIYVIPKDAEVPLLLGDASTDVHFTAIGTGDTNPTAIYKDAQGLVRGEIGFSFSSLPVGQFVAYNGTWQTAERYYVEDGVILKDEPEIIGFHLFQADPNDADAVQGPSITAVNCDLVVHCWKAWL